MGFIIAISICSVFTGIDFRKIQRGGLSLISSFYLAQIHKIIVRTLVEGGGISQNLIHLCSVNYEIEKLGGGWLSLNLNQSSVNFHCPKNCYSTFLVDSKLSNCIFILKIIERKEIEESFKARKCGYSKFLQILPAIWSSTVRIPPPLSNFFPTPP